VFDILINIPVMVKIRVMIKAPSFVGILASCALIFSAVLLLSNAPIVSARFHALLSSLPLALAGIAYAVLQIRLRPRRDALLRRLLLASAFLFWAVDQLLPPGRLAILIGDLVISAYVLDLCWMMQGQADDGEPESRRPARRVAAEAEALAHSSHSRDREPAE
jgi:hypothetical protein